MPLGAADLCHPTRSREPFSRECWVFELKHDGFRALARSGTRAQLLSRTGRSMAEAFPEIVRARTGLPDAVLDGELLVPTGDRRSDFDERAAATCCYARA
jgi:bifunctional non-homologous end joining protein LigD